MSRLEDKDAPLVRFVVGGMQKSGTSALAAWLSAHPGLALPRDKEAHVFDAPDFQDGQPLRQIDQRYLGLYDEAPAGVVHGDATPIYSLHPRFIQRIHAYNPAMRWVLLLRHPVERAVSNYHMEHGWGRERLPLWLALLRERARLRGREDDFDIESPLRHFSYRHRSDYARQLEAIDALFPPEQVLVLRTEALSDDPRGVYLRVCRFLGVDPPPELPDFQPVFVGDYQAVDRGSLRWRVLCWWMRRELRSQARRGIQWDAD